MKGRRACVFRDVAPGREFRLESIGLGYQPDEQATLQPAATITNRGPVVP